MKHDDARGRSREASLSRDRYFSDRYFSLKQLFALSHQLHEIHALKPADILEIGPGNGFVSSFLRRAGYDVVTADINAELSPDICASIEELPSHLEGRVFDLVVCCEVLEHIPFAEFEDNIRTMSTVGRRLYLTIPDCRRVFGFGGVLRLPKWAPPLLNRYVETSSTIGIARSHYWEIGSSPETSAKNIRSILEKYYTDVQSERFALNPYHVRFSGICRSSSPTNSVAADRPGGGARC